MSRAGGRPSGDAPTLRALAAARAGARDGADALLTHLPDVGDLRTQRLLDRWVEQAADTLLALADAAEERLLDLGSGAPAGQSGRVPSSLPVPPPGGDR